MESSSQHDIALSELPGPLGIASLEERPTPNIGPEHRAHESPLPPADGGKDAWLFLAAGFVVEAMVWGELKIMFHLQYSFRMRDTAICYCEQC